MPGLLSTYISLVCGQVVSNRKPLRGCVCDVPVIFPSTLPVFHNVISSVNLVLDERLEDIERVYDRRVGRRLVANITVGC